MLLVRDYRNGKKEKEKKMRKLYVFTTAMLLCCAVALAQDETIGPSGSRFGREPYYYQSENSAWYDSYGRLRYGPRGIPADEYRARKKAEQDRTRRRMDEDLRSTAPEAGARTSAITKTRPAKTPEIIHPEIYKPRGMKVNWKNMFWPLGIPPKHWADSLLDWH